ncbi:bile acid:sodium symporter family protein [bacterium AH-315-C07]|nr:bile acid:sodium symporter family protein [bacterium AH-315-C07]
MDSTATIILGASLFIIMLGMGLSLVVDDFKRILVQPKAILVGLLNQIILLPVIAFTLLSIFEVLPEIAIGIMILAACPGGATSNLITHLAKGDTALSVSLTALSSFITILTIPFIVNFAMVSFADQDQVVQLDIMKTIIQVMVIVVIPVGIGMAIRNGKPGFADKMAKPVKIASAVILGLVIVGIILKEKHNIISYFQQAGLVAFLLNIVTMTVGYFSYKLFKLNAKHGLTISIESGIQNGTMAISIATIILGTTSYAIAPAIYSLIMFFTAGTAIYCGSRMKQEATPDQL